MGAGEWMGKDLGDRIDGARFGKSSFPFPPNTCVFPCLPDCLCVTIQQPTLPHGQLTDLLPLLTIIFRRSLAFPAFSREVTLPVVPKCSQLLVGVAVEAEGKAEWERVVSPS